LIIKRVAGFIAMAGDVIFSSVVFFHKIGAAAKVITITPLQVKKMWIIKKLMFQKNNAALFMVIQNNRVN
jgi:hypothetical protein